MSWISVNDRFPNKGDKVLIFGGFKGMKYQDVAEAWQFSSSSKIGFRDNTDGCWFTKVTHWQTLPEPPKEES